MDDVVIEAEFREIDPDVLELTEEMVVKPKNYWMELFKEYWPLLPIIGWTMYRNAMRIASNYHYYTTHPQFVEFDWLKVLLE